MKVAGERPGARSSSGLAPLDQMESPIEVVRRFCAAWSASMGAAEHRSRGASAGPHARSISPIQASPSARALRDQAIEQDRHVTAVILCARGLHPLRGVTGASRPVPARPWVRRLPSGDRPVACHRHPHAPQMAYRLYRVEVAEVHRLGVPGHQIGHLDMRGERHQREPPWAGDGGSKDPRTIAPS